MTDKNIEVLNKLSNYCVLINNTVNRFGNDLSSFMNDKDYQDSVCMKLLQIGELTSHLSDDFKQEFSSEVDWRGSKLLRNIVAHRYGTIRFEEIWNIITTEIPDIKSFCDDKIRIYTLMTSPAKEAENDEYYDEVIPEPSNGRK